MQKPNLKFQRKLRLRVYDHHDDQKLDSLIDNQTEVGPRPPHYVPLAETFRNFERILKEF